MIQRVLQIERLSLSIERSVALTHFLNKFLPVGKKQFLQYCSRRQCQSRSTRLSSGEYGGSNSGVIRRSYRSL